MRECVRECVCVRKCVCGVGGNRTCMLPAGMV